MEACKKINVTYKPISVFNFFLTVYRCFVFGLYLLATSIYNFSDFYYYLPSDLHESVEGAILRATVKRLPRPAFGNAKILLSESIGSKLSLNTFTYDLLLA